MKLRLISSGIILSILLSLSCSDDEAQINPTEGLTKIAEGVATTANTKVEIWAEEGDLFVGYNILYAKLTNTTTDESINESIVQFMPMMSMVSGMKHSAPVDNPASEQAVNTLYPGAINFIMPSGTDIGSWKLKVRIQNKAKNTEDFVELDLNVVTPEKTRMHSFTTEDGMKYFVSYHFNKKPKVGVNDFEVIIHTKQSMDSFPPVTDFTITMEPEMPSMGHGSPNNISPIHKSNGHYVGKVNFTMTGDWRIHLNLSKGEMVKELYFDLDI
ncbi:MAG TPA: FixH family protein [Cyclobacteriaceae bacterium]|nr:FixH family protein [Cyclobacteriaceae bacterium]